MAWGQVFADPGFLNTVSTGLFGEDSKLSNLVNLFGAGYGLYDTAKKTNTAENNYYDAIKTNKDLVALLAKQSQAQTAYDNALRDRILTQTGDLSASLKNAYTDLGPQPIVGPENIAADYGALKATKMADFNDMLNIVSSQGYANQLDRLGGADSSSADWGRETALTKQYAPQLMAIDQAAMDEAIKRNSDSMNLYNTNRQNILNEITGVLQPGITNETNLYKPQYSMQSSANAAMLAGEFAKQQSGEQKNLATESQKNLADFNTVLQNLFGNKKAATNPATENSTYTNSFGWIDWNK